jgi:hypothetical protein
MIGVSGNRIRHLEGVRKLPALLECPSCGRLQWLRSKALEIYPGPNEEGIEAQLRKFLVDLAKRPG